MLSASSHKGVSVTNRNNLKKAPTGANAKWPPKAKNNNSCRLLDKSPNGFLKKAVADEEEEEEKTARPRKETKHGN